MTPARVLVVDDSVVTRKLLASAIERDPLLEVAATAATASIGLQKIAQCSPDIMLLDVEMPGMDGIEAAARARRDWPRLPILMCSAQTERGAEVTFRALAAGATDYVAKPSSLGQGAGFEAFSRELTGKLKALTRRDQAPATSSAHLATPQPRALGRPEAIVIGCSTGGPNALHQVFGSMPADLGIPVFVVQHMPPVFTRHLADRLTATGRLRVSEALHGELVVSGRAYLAPGGSHLVIERAGQGARLLLNQDPSENSCRPAVDVLFRSAARVYGAGLLGVVLTGMGHDGTRGAREVVAAGGSVVVQDSASCVVATMPGSVAQAGLAREVVPLERMASFLAECSRRRGPP